MSSKNPTITLASFYLKCAAKAKDGPLYRFFMACAKAVLK